MAALKVALCMTSFDRLECAYIGQEIVRLNYKRPLPIYHASSSRDAEQYLDEELLRREPLPLESGAIDLLQTAITAAHSADDYDYLVHLEADTWILDERVIERYVHLMERRGAELGTCGWTAPGRIGARLSRLGPLGRLLLRLTRPRDFCTQFFILKNTPQMREVVASLSLVPGDTVEQKFMAAHRAYSTSSKVLLFRRRHPVTPKTRYECPQMHLYAQHWPARGTSEDPRPLGDRLRVGAMVAGKREALQRYPGVRIGLHLNKLLQADDLTYYNEGAKRY